MFDQRKVGERIARLRKEHGLTQGELAEKLNVTGQAVSKWENGSAMPELSLFIKLVGILNCSSDDLLFQNKKEPNDRILLPKSPAVKKLLEKCKIMNTTEIKLSDVSASQTNEGRMLVSANNGIFKYDSCAKELIISKTVYGHNPINRLSCL